MEKILVKLSPKVQTPGVKSSPSKEILAKLSEQQTLLDKQKHLLVNTNANPSRPLQMETFAASGMSPLTPAAATEATTSDSAELLRLKQELLAANSRIAVQEQELAQTRVMNHTLDQALGSPSEVDFNGRDVSEQTISNLQDAFNGSNGTFNQLHDAWNGQEDSHSDMSDTLSTGTYGRARGFWAPPAQQAYGIGMDASASGRPFGEPFPLPAGSIGAESNKFWGGSNMGPALPVPGSSFPSQRVLSGSSSTATSVDGRLSGEQARYLQGPGLGPRRPLAQANRGDSCFPTQSSPWGTFPTAAPGSPVSRSATNRPSGAYQPVGVYSIPPYNPRPIGTPLSPTATEFTSTNANTTPWVTPMVSRFCRVHLVSSTANVSRLALLLRKHMSRHLNQ